MTYRKSWSAHAGDALTGLVWGVLSLALGLVPFMLGVIVQPMASGLMLGWAAHKGVWDYLHRQSQENQQEKAYRR